MFTLSFSTDNAAFSESGEGEVINILHKVKRDLMAGHYSGAIMDTNGNTIGEWSCELPDDDL